MPWWSWLVIWTCLSLALLAVLAVSAWRLFRKLVAVFDALDDLAAKAELLEGVAEEAEAHRGRLAILAGRAETARRRERVRAAALERRRARHESRLARGRAIIAVDASTREWFSGR